MPLRGQSYEGETLEKLHPLKGVEPRNDKKQFTYIISLYGS